VYITCTMFCKHRKISADNKKYTSENTNMY